jgi:EAL domain-containing protein (putative c-di-GMP-specific phosphodiesterase class I)
LARAADIALYDAKASGRGTMRLFRPELAQRLLERQRLEEDLRCAIAREELVLLFQPLVRLADRRIIGAEALLRWQHPTRGLLPPASFIGIAEETGLIVPIGAWALRHACAAATAWPAEIGLAVNLSPAQFASLELVGTVGSALADSRLAPGRLALEVTESVLLRDDQRTQEALSALHGIGVAIAMDDFGTGYSSLSYLRHFAIDRIKIDQSFTQTVETQTPSSLIMAAIVAIGSGLKITICAEGIENDAQMAAVARLGVQEGQGFWLHPPMTGADVTALMRRQAAAPALDALMG